ncbi:hypothetical protein [Modestobacter sp. VKM Ac-2985]|uniref:hypothetical protein n=1 Tax=Modestobacter sp. VKM Ac-2985 TaxID=3004139 RepID=UPI0022AB9485|nr:hypothetical protein [Modestobacter sp. VKM Ac-2985]MCZ2837669.1 hypothetical protein [Modestobacter sp. VKM Ac-2985]
MNEPETETDQPNLHPGQHDEGGTGGMATRELQARHSDDDGTDEPDRSGRPSPEPPPPAG